MKVKKEHRGGAVIEEDGSRQPISEAFFEVPKY